MSLTQSEGDRASPASVVLTVPAPGLLATIETEVVPRLMRAHCGAAREPTSTDRIEELARLAARQDLAAGLAAVDRASHHGWTIEAVYLQLIAPAARWLGQQWTDDALTFVEVSVGLATLQQLVHLLAARRPAPVAHRGWVVLAAAPGEQHTLGLSLAAELMRRARWSVQVGATEAELLQRVGSEPVALVGFTVSAEARFDRLAALLAAVRKVSVSRELLVMVGGSVPLEGFASSHRCLVAGSALNAVRLLDRVATVPACARANCDEKRRS